MKIAIIGSGIAGNTIAHHLHPHHDLTMFEASDHIGGHTHTHTIELMDECHQIDTGFIVFNQLTYPHFTQLLADLGVKSQPSHMSFSVRNERTGVEYNGTTLNSLFSQRLNLFRPSFHRMIRDILRFNREATDILSATSEISLGDYLAAQAYSPQFIEDYLIPMGAAIWSTDPERMMAFPARFFVLFFHNHGMLSVNDRPEWRVIQGGSACYVETLVAPFRHHIRLSTPVKWVKRTPTNVLIKANGAEAEEFDYVFMACHADQSLQLLDDATPVEREVLSAIPYQENEAILHTDASLLPRKRLSWGAWNVHVAPEYRERIALTYNMNILQNLASQTTFCVTLNRAESIDPKKILKRVLYHHPVYTPEGVSAQQRQSEINGPHRTYFCGAYWGFGFHEDGVVSALNALNHFEHRTQ